MPNVQCYGVLAKQISAMQWVQAGWQTTDLFGNKRPFIDEF